MGRLGNERGETWEPGCRCATCWLRRLMEWRRRSSSGERVAARGRTASGALPQAMGCALVLLLGSLIILCATIVMLLWEMWR